MVARHLLSTALGAALAVVLCAAQSSAPQSSTPQSPASPGKLPIVVPAGATVNFEADTPGSAVQPILDELLAAGVLESGARPQNIVIRTGLGNIEMTPHDVADLLRPVRELHVVAFSLAKDSSCDPMRTYEDAFTSEGMHRVGNEAGVLVMRRTGDRYALVMRQRDNVTVLRVDGMPNLGQATNVVLRSIARAAANADKNKHP